MQPVIESAASRADTAYRAVLDHVQSCAGSCRRGVNCGKAMGFTARMARREERGAGVICARCDCPILPGQAWQEYVITSGIRAAPAVSIHPVCPVRKLPVRRR